MKNLLKVTSTCELLLKEGRTKITIADHGPKRVFLYKGLGSIRGYFGLNILGKLNTFV